MKLNKKVFQIACDGGAATGKSTGAKMIAKKYKLKFLSSGILYRYASYLLIKYKPKNQTIFLRKKFKKFSYKKVDIINLHTQEISNYSAVIAKKNSIRKVLKNFQISFVKKNKNCCIEGRDIGTKILPNADLKFFFKCNLNLAAYRRYKELKKRNNKIKLKDVKKALRIRNNHDLKRKNSPLKKHRNAIEIDTGKLNKREMLNMMSKHVLEFLK
ncbi:(d)CMP kinase [Candidatus Pelagibacter bacterium]|nr:(d)CMP kinase [Candidatus Pelagibacter bacterium]